MIGICNCTCNSFISLAGSERVGNIKTMTSMVDSCREWQIPASSSNLRVHGASKLAAMRYNSATIGSFLAVGALCCWVNVADSKPALCSTSDDGSFLCEFRATAQDGSFEISAPGKPTYILNMIEPGVAAGFMSFGTRNIPLPGRYLRSRIESACWVNDMTRTKICAK